VVEDLKLDSLVMGSRGLGQLKRYVLSTDSSQLASSINCWITHQCSTLLKYSRHCICNELLDSTPVQYPIEYIVGTAC